MSDLRETIARAIYEHREGPVANADFGRQQALWHDCLLQANAALAAIEAAGWQDPVSALADQVAARCFGIAEGLEMAFKYVEMASTKDEAATMVKAALLTVEPTAPKP